MKISPADTKCNQTHGERNEISTELADTRICTEALVDDYIYNVSIMFKLVNRIGTECHNLDLHTDILHR